LLYVSPAFERVVVGETGGSGGSAPHRRLSLKAA
jgi:hypothetical protein